MHAGFGNRRHEVPLSLRWLSVAQIAVEKFSTAPQNRPGDLLLNHYADSACEMFRICNIPSESPPTILTAIWQNRVIVFPKHPNYFEGLPSR
ncbi:MAG: hypothetical protein K2Y37_09990 [Pirellulales bacterium]|nr:hypothetical protein [Pirellulales bacterium]